ncbi:uncharacterized protein ACMZJ9_016716 [Mantella aurantiaca]
MNPAAKKPRLKNILIRLCDKFTRNEVNVICPMIKAENSVRVLYKLKKELLEDVSRKAGEPNGLKFSEVHWISSPDNKMNESTIFIEYTRETDQNDCLRLKKNLESELAEVLKGSYTLTDEVDDMNKIVPQPIVSETDYELYKLELFSQELEEILEKCPEFRTVADTVELALDDLKECYTTFAVLSQNGKGKSFILNLLLLMTADSKEEYINNNKPMKLPKGFPDHVIWEEVKKSDLSSLPNVLKDFLKESNNKPPVCYQLTSDTATDESSANSFCDIDQFFSNRRMLDLEPYVLSQKDSVGSYESTTKCIIRLRYGPVYQMKVEYFEAEELQQQLYELFITDTDADSSFVNDVIKEQAEKCLKARYKDLTGEEFIQENPVNCYEDIHLSKEVLKFAGKTELYIGKGQNSTYDRLALQNVLNKLTTVREVTTAEEAKRKIAAVKEILVYVPSKILYGNKEILEMPGTDDSDPIAMFSISNALKEADAVIFVSEYGFKICEKEVKEMLSDSGFLQKFEENPASNKLMLIAYPEKNLKWQFSQRGKNNIEKLEQETRQKKENELKEIAKMLKKISDDHVKSIFTTYLLPVLHTSILSQTDSKPEHEIIAEHSGFLKHTGIVNLFIQLDEYVLSKQKASFDQAKTSFENFMKIIIYNMDPENAKKILQNLGSIKFKGQLKEHNKNFEDNLKEIERMLLCDVEAKVDYMLKEYVPEAKQQWNAYQYKVTSIAAYNPNFIGKSPKFKVRLFHIIFEEFEVKKKKIFSHILEGINRVFEKYKCNVSDFYYEKLNSFLKPLGFEVSFDFIKEVIDDKMNDAHQRYMGNIIRPFNEKTLEKLMDESQRASLKYVILIKNYKNSSLDEAKKATADDIEECMTKVKEVFMKKLYDLHNHRFKSVYTLLWLPKGGSKIWRELELEIRRTARDRSEVNKSDFEQVIQRLKLIMEADFNGSPVAEEQEDT